MSRIIVETKVSNKVVESWGYEYKVLSSSHYMQESKEFYV
jgi:hypothetical protein